MKQRISRYFIAAMMAMGIAGCGNDLPNEAENQTVSVKLNLATAPMVQQTDGSRASQPMIPANENPIYDIRVMQFDAEGIIIGSPFYHACDESGELTHELHVELAARENSTVCVLANFGPNFRYNIDNLETFRTILLDAPLITEETDLGSEDIGHLKDQSMYLYGFYQGKVTDNNINILLGRLFMRINLEITNSTGQDLENVKVEITNVPRVTHIPFVDAPLEAKYLIESYTETISKIENGAVSGQYYYMPENIRPTQENATKLTITTADGKSASVKLGNDPPKTEAAERDYSLNRNNIYTFKVNLAR